MRYLSYAFWLIVVILTVIFVILNSRMVVINFYAGNVTFYFPLLLIILLAVGALLGALALIPALVRAKTCNRKLKQRIQQSEQEVQNLRAIPIKDNC